MDNIPRKQQRKDRYKKLRGKRRRLRNVKFFVPKGHYCYGKRADGKFITCPFLKFDRSKHYQESGICEAFKMRDADHWGLLWDMVKECGINERE